MLKLAMEIKLTSDNGLQLNGKRETVLINPSSELLKTSAARIVIYAKEQVKHGLLTEDNRVIIIGPGEYEIGGVEVLGYGDGSGGFVYTVLIDGVTVGLLGRLTTELSEKKVDRIGSVDVLVADIGENNVSGNKSLLKLAKGWGVNYLLPVGYKMGEQAIQDFLNLTDNEGMEAVSGLKIDKDNLPEGLEVVLLHE